MEYQMINNNPFAKVVSLVHDLIENVKEGSKIQGEPKMVKFNCIDCGEAYYLSENDIKKHYLMKNLSVPKRCPKCRKLKKDNDLLAMEDIKTLILLIKEREVSKSNIITKLTKDPDKKLISFYDGLTVKTRNEIIHNWARIRKLYVLSDPSLALILPHDHKQLENYIRGIHN